MGKASTNIQKTGIRAFYHNNREAIVHYLIDSSMKNECNLSGKEAFDRFILLYEEAATNYSSRTKQSMQLKQDKLLWEAVINLEERHTKKDVSKVVDYLEKFSWQSIQVAIHRDEGHRNEDTGRIIYNYHAHIVFMPLNKQGIYCFKKNTFGRKKMSQIQTDIAKLLGMDRGKSKRETKKVRLSHAQYRQVALEKEELEFEIDRLKLDVETFEDCAFHEYEEKLQAIKLNKKLQVQVDKLQKELEEVKQSSMKITKCDDTKSLKITIPSIL